MKKIIFFVVMMFSSFLLKGQEIKSDTTIYTYCEILGTESLFSGKVKISIDYGEARKYFFLDLYKDPTTGKPFVFNSMVDALNFMGKDHWQVVLAYAVSGGQSGNFYHFLLKKQIFFKEKQN